MSTIVEFDALPWEIAGEHVRQKKFVVRDRVIRLLELSDGFAEADWCWRAHDGYVLSGELQLTFTDRSVVFGAGNGLHLGGSESEKHKAAVIHGPVLLFLVEPASG